MHAVGMQSASQLHAVVDDEYRSGSTAQGQRLTGDLLRLRVGRLLHAQLYPAASSLQCNTHGVEVRDGIGMMCNELYAENRSTPILISDKENESARMRTKRKQYTQKKSLRRY